MPRKKKTFATVLYFNPNKQPQFRTVPFEDLQATLIELGTGAYDVIQSDSPVKITRAQVEVKMTLDVDLQDAPPSPVSSAPPQEKKKPKTVIMKIRDTKLEEAIAAVDLDPDSEWIQSMINPDEDDSVEGFDGVTESNKQPGTFFIPMTPQNKSLIYEAWGLKQGEKIMLAKEIEKRAVK
jgi:hypothetical protein